jgi:thiol:disulfide interchange protein
VRLLICRQQGEDENCLPPKTVPPVSATFTVAGSPVEVEEKYRPLVEPAGPRAAPPPKDVEGSKETPRQPVEESTSVGRRLALTANVAEDLRAVREQLPPPDKKNAGFWVFVGTAAFWGLITLLTPCVFPMVPITVSIFVKQGEKQGSSPLRHALVYATTIVILLAVAALTLLTVFSRLAVHPVTNVLLGVLFVVLALSLFGLFELTLPSFLADATGKRAGQGGYLGTVFMAASFTVISFTCVAPFLGGFSVMATSGDFSFPQLLAGAVAFGGAFASPFFLLALFPSLIKKIPRSGDWMNMIKVSMGFLELAAALKFFRTAELRWLTPPAYFTYDVVMALWIAILGAMALYLFGLFRTRHDHEAHDHVGPVRILFGLGAAGLAVYLLPALFGAGPHERNRPGGAVYAWVDSFLLPEPSAAEVVGGDLAWSADLRRTLDNARARGGRVFVDFTGVTCTNCKLNEREVFTKPEVKDLMKQYGLVQLYTDTVPETFYESDPGRDRRNADAEANLEFEKAAFGEEQLPLYVILKPEATGKTTVVGIYGEGKINDVPGFVQFLKDGLK